MQRRVFKLGKSSIAVILPKQACQLIGISAGDLIEIGLHDGVLELKKVEDDKK